MTEREWLAERFEEQRPHLRAVAYRMLGSLSEAEDATQEAWLRLSRTGADEIENLGGWLTTVVARVCLDMLRSRKARREELLSVGLPEPIAPRADGIDPEHEALLADSIGQALLVVLETLSPPERVAFVLHDMFAVPFDEIAQIIGRSPVAARQLASRARRRVQGAAGDADADPNQRWKIVDAFLAAARGGNFDALLAMLDPDVAFRADDAAVRIGAAQEIRGAAALAQAAVERAQGLRLALVDGVPALVAAPGGQLRAVFSFTIANDKIVAIEMLADPARLAGMDLAILDGEA